MIETIKKITNKEKLNILAEQINNMLSEMGFDFDCHIFSKSIYYNNLSFIYKNLYYKYWLLRVSDHLPNSNADRRERDFYLYYSKTKDGFYLEEIDINEFKEKINTEKQLIISELDKLIELKKINKKEFLNNEKEVLKKYGVEKNRKKEL